EMFEFNFAFEAKFLSGGIKRCDRDGIAEHIVQPAERRGLRGYYEPRGEQPQVVTVARTQHHPMVPEADGIRIAIGREVTDFQFAHCFRLTSTLRTIALSRHSQLLLKSDSARQRRFASPARRQLFSAAR